MKYVVLFFVIIATLSLGTLKAQVYTEDFESTVSMISNPTGSWNINTRIFSQGLKCDSIKVGPNSISYLTTPTINTLGKYVINLKFDQICKIELFDSAWIEVSNDDGISWTRLTDTNYLSDGLFGLLGNRFCELSYGIFWGSTNPISPDQSWWKGERFDISTLAANSATVKIRFVLIDGNQIGAAGRAGWFIDNIIVDAEVSELIPPSITLLNPIVEDTIYNGSSVKISAEITDDSGIDSAICIINVMPLGETDSILMVLDPTISDTYSCQIPFYGYGRTVNYYIKAWDASGSHNYDTTSTKSYISKHSINSQALIGLDSNSSNYPFATDDNNAKTHLLYTASELSAAGLSGGAISSIAFDVINVASTPMNGFNIRMKSTLDTSITVFETTGFTTVYSPNSYTVTGTGWQTITFSSPFVWDGSSNLLIEIYYNNTVNTQNSAVYSSPAAGKTFANASYFTAGAAITYGYLQSNRPNIKLNTISDNIINDIGVKHILNPTSGITVGNDFEVKVDLFNYGVDTIYNAQINWTYDGLTQTPYILSSTNSILPGANISPIILDTITATLGVHHIIAWSNLPNDTIDNNFLNDTSKYIFLGCSGPISGTYTIGGIGADYATINDAILTMYQCGISGPIVFNINSGTYTEQLNINAITGISNTNTVIFQSTSGDSSTVNINYDASNLADNFVVKIDGISNITFKNLSFTAMDADFANVIVLENDVQNISFLNNIIKTANPASFNNNNMFLISGFAGNNINISNNQLLGASKSIMLNANAPRTLWKIKDNIIYDNYTSAITLDSAISAEITGNKIHNSTICFANYKAIVLNGNSDTTKITENDISISETSTPIGIELNNCNFSSTNYAVIANNFILLRSNAISTDLAAGIKNNLSSNVNFYYNTINISGGNNNSASISLYGNTSDASQNINIVNNIFANNAGGYLYYVSNVDTNLWSCDHNNLWNNNTGGFVAKLGSSEILLTNWALGSGATNFLNVDPYFSSSSDLHTANNLLDGTAIPIVGITIDIDRELRNTSTPDIGADEFDFSPWDATLVKLFPLTNGCGLSNELVKIKIKNTGSATINGSTTTPGNFNASFKVNNIIYTETITDSIQPGEVYEYTFIQLADLSVSNVGADSTFLLESWLSLVNDPRADNDSASLSIYSVYAPLPPMVSDTSINYADSITLTAVANDNIIWYATDSSYSSLASSATYNTGVLYDTTTYWVGTFAGENVFKITEILQYKDGAGTSYPSYFPTTTFSGIEISNVGLGAGDLSGYTIHVFSDSYNPTINLSYTFPANTSINSGDVATALYGIYLTIGPAGNNVFNISTNNNMSSSNSSTYWLADSLGNIVDAFSYKGGVFPTTSGVTTSDFNGTLASFTGFSYAGAIRNISDNNDSTDWDFVHTSNTLGSLGVYNSQIPLKEVSCTSTLVPLTVDVLNIPLNDIGITELLQPISGYDLSSTQEVELVIKNFGANTQSVLPLAYSINNSTIVYDTLYRTLNSSDTAHYVLNNTVDLSQFGVYNFDVYTTLTSDSDNSNDSVISIITNDSLAYCISEATNIGDSRINNIILEGINNNTDDANCVKYSDFSSMSTVLTKGQTYQISGTFGTCNGSYSKGAKAFIDYNNDGDFDDASEEIANFGSNTSTFTSVETFTVPLNAVSGNQRLRIVLKEYPGTNNVSITPCGTYSYGETEDYTVTLIQQIPFDASVTAITNIADTTYEGTNITPVAHIKNYGTDTLNAFEINYKVNNGTPITYNYNSQLAPGATDSVSLVSFASPNADVNLCVYTYHPQDNNSLNDKICTDYFAIPSKDAEMFQIESINEYCGMQYETVKVQITNIGIDTINSTSQTTPTTVSYQSNNLSPITETLTTVIAPGDSLWYTFTHLVYVGSNNIMDSVYNISSWISFSGDNISSNDTAYLFVESLHQPSMPIVTSPISVSYASTATVSASSAAIDSVLWFSDSTSTNPLFGGTTYTTPWIHTVDTTYWAQSTSKGAPSINYLGTGTDHNYFTTYPTPYGSYYTGNKEQYLILASELNALGFIEGDIRSISFDVSNINNVGSLSNFEMRIGHSTQTAISAFENNLTTVLSLAGNYTPINGWNLHEFSNPFYWDGSSNIVIQLCSQNASSVGFGNASVNRTNTGYNSAYYTKQDATGTCSVTTGTASNLRPNMKINGSTLGCGSARVPFDINILTPSNCDVGISDIIGLSTTIYLTNSEIIKVKVHNYGALAQTAIPVSYQINGGSIITETVSVAALSSLNYSFATPADLSIIGQPYNIKAFTSLACDTANLNDTFATSVTNLTPTYCISTATATSLHDIMNVDFGGINNTSPVPYDKLYTDFTSLAPALLPPGSNQPISITISSSSPYSYSGNGYLKIYIDYNKDGSYDPISEEAFSSSYSGALSTGPTTITGSISIPSNVTNGLSQMRIVAVQNGSATNVVPCGTYSFGETEDYSVVFSTVIAKDAGVEQVICDNITALYSIPVIARIKNYGVSSIDSVDVSYTVNGGTPVTINYNTTINGGDNVDINLGNLTVHGGMNNICVYTTLAGDSNAYNNQKCRNVYKDSIINLSYTDDFEGSMLWFNDTLDNQWEHGAPTMTNINSAHSPTNVWAIDLDGNYNNHSIQYLYTPVFNIPSNVDSAELKFWHYFDCEINNDGGYIQYQKNNSNTWFNLGYFSDQNSTNWYNNVVGGVHKWSGSSLAWQQAKYLFDFNDINFSGTNTLKFRFAFYSNYSINYDDGWAIDDFSFSIPTVANDAGISAINNPNTTTVAGQTTTVSIEVTNFGTNMLTSIPVYYAIDGASPITETYTPIGGLAVDSTQTYTFNTSFSAPFINFNICAGTDLAGDPTPTNNEICCSNAVSAPAIDASVSDVGFIQMWGNGDSTSIYEPVTVIAEIKNLGTNTLTSIPIKYNVSGNFVNEVWNGSIAPNEVDTFQFSQAYNSPNSNYTICVEVNAVGDNNTDNDEFCLPLIGNSIDDANSIIFEVYQNEPNPAVGNVRINYIVPTNGDINFELRNTLGQVIYTTKQASFTGKNTIEVDADKLANGVYYYSVVFDGKCITRKMIVNQ